MPRFRPEHFDEFVRTPYAPQAPFGKAPRDWALATIGVDDPSLPAAVLTRPQVRQLCSAPHPVLRGYMAAMAWGMQGSGLGGHANAKKAWAAREVIRPRLELLRAGGLSRHDAYELFGAKGTEIPGLGPSYFTKLIYFFSPTVDGEPDRYIMDQWTAKSVNLLTGEHVVRMSGPSPASSNTGVNFEAFCAEIDALARHLNRRGQGQGHHHCGNDVEQMLFSLGSFNRQPQHAWRAYVDTTWESARPTHAYSQAQVTHRAQLP